ncbi:MAG: hypothetical protein ACPGJS_23240 [Flammeovirgaceae bacterium]
MSRSTKHTIKNIFKISFMVLAINVCALTTQYFLEVHHNTAQSELSISEYTHTLIEGKILPIVCTVTDQFLK